MSNHAQPQNTFIIRFWWELHRERPNPTGRWRGRIEHVQSGEGITFHDARQLLAFMERFVTPLAPRADGTVSSIMEEQP